jgi:putative endonuclease
MERHYYVYILASRRNGTLYVGVTNNLARRVWQHREGEASAFTRKYGVKMLVWYTAFENVHDAIACEKRLKRWRRAWKLARIEEMNPDWRDLYETLNQ